MAITVGSVYVDLLPSASKFAGEAGRELDPIIKAIGKKVAEELGRAIGKGVSDGVEDGVSDADPGAAAEKQGTKTGGKFAQSFKRTLEAALKSLPEINLDANTKPALRNVANLREQISKLNASIDVDVDPKKALAGVEKLQRELEFILGSDAEIDIKVDAADALKSVEALRAEIARSLDRSSKDAGKFARDLNAKLTAAIQALPQIDIRANADGAELTLRTIRAQLAELSGKRIDIDITVGDAVAKAEAQLARLQELLSRDNLRASVRVNTEAAVAELEVFLRRAQGLADVEPVEVVIEPNLGAFNAKLKSELAAIAASIRPIEITADDTGVRATIERLRLEMASLSARIGVDVDAATAIARLAEIEAIITALDLNDVHIDVEMDIAGALAKLAALRAAAAAVGSAAAAGVGEANSHFSRMQLIITAVLALFPLIAAAIIALPGLIAAVITPVAAIALGFEGIKNAVAPLMPLFQQLKTEISSVFSEGLGPTISAFKELFDVVGPGLKQTAIDVVSVANGIAQTAANSKNLPVIANSFDLINKAIAASGPWLNQLTTNLINLVNIGAQALPTFQAQMAAVGEAWRVVIERLQATGLGQQAVEALLGVLTSLLSLLAPLTQLGAEMAAGFGPALSGAIQILTVAFQALAAVFSILPGGVNAAISTLTVLLGVLALLGKLPASITVQLAAMRAAMVATAASATAAGGGFAAAGAGVVAFGRALGLLLLNPVVLAIAGISAALYLLSSAQGDAAAAAANHASFVSNLTAQLQTTNGVVTDSTRLWVTQSEEWKTAAAGTKEMGISLSFMTDAALGNEDSLARMRAQLEAGIRSHKEFAADVFNNRDATEYWNIELDDTGEKLRDSLIALNSMSTGMKDAKQAIKDAADALKEQGISLVGGVKMASDYKDSIKKIGDEMSTTADRANGLKTALDILSGRQLSLLEANANYSNSIRTIGGDFQKFLDQIKAGNTTFLDSAGRLNVSSEAGAKYALSLGQIVTSATNASAAAFDAAGGVANLTQSVPKATEKIQELRDIFVKQAMATGLSETAAKHLADTIGLMPSVVSTLFQGKGIPQMQQDLLILQQQMQLLAKDHPITVTALTDEAKKQLASFGIIVNDIPGTKETVLTITDDAAKKKYQDFIAGITAPGVANIPTDLDLKNIAPALAGVFSNITAPPTGTPKVPVDVDATKVPAAVDDIKKNVAGQPMDTAPVDVDATKVPAQTGAIAATVNTTVANMPVNIIKGSGWDGDIALIRDSVLLTVGNLPINPIKGSGWDTDIVLIRDSVLLVVATMPINPIKGSGWDTELALMKAAVAALPYAAMPIDVVKSLNFDLQLANLKLLITAPIPPYPAIPVDVIKSLNFDLQLQALKNLITIPTTPVAIPIDINTATATTNFNNFVNGIRNVVAAFKVDCSTALAIDRLFKFWDGLAKVVAVFGVDADVSLAIQTIDALVQAIQQMVVPFTVVAVFGGFSGGILGGAAGGVVGGGPNINQRVGNAPGQSSEAFAGFPDSQPAPFGTGNGPFFNPGADLDTGNFEDIRPDNRSRLDRSTGITNALGNLLKLHAVGGIDSLTPMGKVASVVPPNTWRVIGDRMTDDEAFIPINGSSRSKSILALTASRMGFGVTPMDSGGLNTQTVGAMAPMAAQSAQGTFESGQAGGKDSNGDSYTFNISNSSANAYELADEALFRLRYQKFGGAYSGRR